MENYSILDLYMKDLGRVDFPDENQERDLFQKYKEGDKAAREILIRSCLPLVIRLAKEHSGQGLPLLDLIQAGNTGLLHAFRRFDINKGRLVNYAGYWIKWAIIKTLKDEKSQSPLQSIPLEEFKHSNKETDDLTRAALRHNINIILVENLKINVGKNVILFLAEYKSKRLSEEELKKLFIRLFPEKSATAENIRKFVSDKTKEIRNMFRLNSE